MPKRCLPVGLVIWTNILWCLPPVMSGDTSPHYYRLRLPGRSYSMDYEEEVDNDNYYDKITDGGSQLQAKRTENTGSNPWSFRGNGREFHLFGSSSNNNERNTKKGTTNNKQNPTQKNVSDDMDDDDDEDGESPEKYPDDFRFGFNDDDDDNQGWRSQIPGTMGGRNRQSSNYQPQSTNSLPRGDFPFYSRVTKSRSRSNIFQPVQDWWTTNISPNVKSWPKLRIRVEPTTTLKIRKTFRPLGTILRLGANFNTQLGVWQFHSSWEDAIIGGKLTLAGRELQITKSWQLSVGAMEDLVTRLRFRAAVDLSTWKAYARVGFRTERLSPINVMEGFTLQKQVPLDGLDGHVKLQVKANFRLPEPEIEYSTETQRSLIGMGDIQVSIEELNLLLDY